MRKTLVSLIALAGFAPAAFAQMAGPAPMGGPTAMPAMTSAGEPAPAAPAPVAAAPAPAAAAVPAAPSVQTPAAPVATPAAPVAAAPVPAPTTPTAAVAAPASTAPASATSAPATPTPEAAPPPPPPPAPPPPAPTDPAAIAVLNTLETVCIPSAAGGNLAQIAKSAGYRKSGENFVLKGQGYQLTILSNAYNTTQCHVDIVHAVDPEAPAKPLVVALHNWAAVSRDWTLYKNNKFVQGAQEITVRSWEHSGGGKDEGLVFNTLRKADGTPSKGNQDTSMMIYSQGKTPG